MRQFGLTGYPLGHSFSQKYFTEKFRREGRTDCEYLNLPLPDIRGFDALVKDHPLLEGLNVTIPWKQAVIPFLDNLSPVAREAGAVNCITISGGKTTGHNTDVTGFEQSLLPLLQPHHRRALVLGTGGASLAVIFVLRRLKIPCLLVSRDPAGKSDAVAYADLNEKTLRSHRLIINTTPLGMYPQTDTAPPIPYEFLTPQHLLYDLVYNPAETLFLKRGKEQGAAVKNGEEMLVLQAEASWQIWLNG